MCELITVQVLEIGLQLKAKNDLNKDHRYRTLAQIWIIVFEAKEPWAWKWDECPDNNKPYVTWDW